MVAATLSCLRNNGCFAEIGKRDIWSAQRIHDERPDVHHKLVAIDFLPVQVSGTPRTWCHWVPISMSWQEEQQLTDGLAGHGQHD